MAGKTELLGTSSQRGGLGLLALVLAATLAVLCHQGFLPHRIFFANDMPLGAMMDSSDKLPGTFAGHWGTLYWIGGVTPSSSPAFSILLQAILPPQIFLKVYAPLTMLVLGLAAGWFFKQLGFAPGVCIVGGLGAGLNMHCFSNACWGLGQWNIAAAMVFVSMTALVSPIRPPWVKAALTGLSLGMVVMEGFDLGAILSLYVGMFIVFYLLSNAPDPGRAIPKTIGMGTVIVFFALLISGSTLYTLVGTQIKGTVNVGQSESEKQAQWEFTTQWSFPKLETLRLFIPGLFGYRLQEFITDTNKASAYWGKIAEDPRIDELQSSDPKVRAAATASLTGQQDIINAMAGNDPAAHEEILTQIRAQLQRRHTGSGDYTGVLVCLLAAFGLCNTWREGKSPYSKQERESVWFWGAAALFSLGASWGRYGSLYHFIYHLPFLSNIRNPIKFLHPLNLCLIILSGYGLEALYRLYLRDAVARKTGLLAHVAAWWKKSAGFDRRWAVAMGLIIGLSIAAVLILGSNKSSLVHYLQRAGFSSDVAPQIADFCVKEVVLFVLFFSVSAAVLTGVLSKAWTGGKAKVAWIILGTIMIVDLGRADLPWVHYFDYKEKYSMNPVVDFLRHEPWEHRVMSRTSPTGPYDIEGEGNLGAICHFWLENDYLANNIESLEIDQAPRLPDIDRDYIGNFMVHSARDFSPAIRLWRLTNTKYIVADAQMTGAFNQSAPDKNSFRDLMRMDIVQKPEAKSIEDAGDLTVQTNANGHVALIEFDGALPRAKLYSNWQTTNDSAALAILNSAEFDPVKTVLIAEETPPKEKSGPANADAGTVAIDDYQPKDVKLTANAKTSAVLLLNDRTGEYWKAWVDGKPARILRCNYIMRGVFLEAGQHTIEFHYRAPLQWLYVSVAALGVGVALAGYVALVKLRSAGL